MRQSAIKATLLVLSVSAILGGCHSNPPQQPAPPPVTVIPAPIVQPLVSTTIPTDQCCYHPSEIVKYQNKSVADCSAPVQVIRYKNTCHDCPYPVVVRADSLCGNK